MSAPVRVCALSELPAGTAIAVRVDGEDVAVVRAEDGGVHALRDRCSHANVALSEGDVVGGTIECWLHGSGFDLVTGRPTSLPAITPVPVHPVTIDGDDVLVALSPTQES